MRRQIDRSIPEENLRAGAAGRYLGVAGEAIDDLARPGLEGAVFAAAGIEINAAERHAVAEIAEFDPDAAALAIYESAGSHLGD